MRVSRLGQRGTIRTRSGLVIGGRVHFFTDLSPIATEDIELHTLGEISGSEEMIDGLGSSSVIEFPRGGDSVVVPRGSDSVIEEELLETDSVDLSSSRLELLTASGNSSFVVLEQLESVGPDMFFPGIDTGTHVFNPQENSVPNVLPADVFPETTVVILSEDFADFYLHPSLRKRKRKFLIR